MEILLSYHQNTTTHIIDHIHEWQQWCRLCKIQLDDKIFLDWFLKNLLPPIAKDVTFEQTQTEEEAILKTQQLDLVYTQSSYLYTIILDAPRVGTSRRDTSRESHTMDGVIGSVT